MSHNLLLIFSCILDLKEKSQETCSTSFLSLVCKGTIVILLACRVLDHRKKKRRCGAKLSSAEHQAEAADIFMESGFQKIAVVGERDRKFSRSEFQLCFEGRWTVDLKDKRITAQQSSILVLNSFHCTRQKKKKKGVGVCGFRVFCLSAWSSWEVIQSCTNLSHGS